MRLLAFLTSLACTFASAEETLPHTCRILFLAGPENAPEKLHLFDGSASQEVELPRMNFSKVYKIAPGPRTLFLTPTPAAKPENVPAGAPKAVLSATIGDFYLILASDPANSVAPVSMQVIDAGSAKFRPGEMMWFNLTQNSVGGQLGSQQLAMKANSRTIIPAPATGNTEYKVNLAFRMPDNERLYPLCETSWLHDPRSRSVYFIVGESGVRTPRVLGFPDFREPEKKESATPQAH